MTEATPLLMPDLIDAALPQTPETFDPAITVVAITTPRELHGALRNDREVLLAEEAEEARTRMQQLHEEEMAALAARRTAGKQGFQLPSRVNVPAVTAKTEVIELNTVALERHDRMNDLNRIAAVRMRLAKGAMALAFLPGAIMGCAGSVAFLYALQQDGTVEVRGDGSILPGSEQGIIPGFPDIADGIYTTTMQEGKVVITTKSQTEGREFSVKYPYAGKKLTGKEAALGLQKVLPILQYAKEHNATVEEVKIKGEASDEPLLGVREPHNKTLALDRAKDAKTGFMKLAAAAGVRVNEKQIHVKGQERVLSQNQQNDIAKLASAANLQPTELLRQYNAKSGPFTSKNPAIATDDLDKYISDARGVTYSVKLDVPAKVATPTTTTVTKEHAVGGLSGEWVAGGVALLLGFLSMTAFSEAIGGRLAKVRAGRQLEREEKRLSDIAKLQLQALQEPSSDENE